MYSLKKKNSNLDYAKRQILLVQESYKIFVPFLAVLTAGLLALNIANAVHNFMAVYICVIVNVIGVGAGCGLVLSLIRGNTRQRNLFAQLAEHAQADDAEQRILQYVSDTGEVLKRANVVRVIETESAYIVLPLLPEYKHRMFTRYDFRGDFGRLVLPKEEYKAEEDDNGVSFVSEDMQFKFAAVKK